MDDRTQGGYDNERNAVYNETKYPLGFRPTGVVILDLGLMQSKIIRSAQAGALGSVLQLHDVSGHRIADQLGEHLPS